MRKGIFFKLKVGAKKGYQDAHQMIWPEMVDVLTESGIRNYSIWNHETFLFASFEVDDEVYMQQVLDKSAVYQKWRDYMEEFVYIEPETGLKEWPMEECFFLKGK